MCSAQVSLHNCKTSLIDHWCLWSTDEWWQLLLLKAGKDLGSKAGDNRRLVGMLQPSKCFHDTDALVISNLSKLFSTKSSLMITYEG